MIIVYNPYNTNMAPAYRAFSSAFETIFNGGQLRTYDLVTPSNETWSPDSAFITDIVELSLGESDMTYRVTGQQFPVWVSPYSYQLVSNSGVLVNLNNSATYWGMPRITTNFTNQRDLYLDWTEGMT